MSMLHPIFLHAKSFMASPARYVAAWRRFKGYGTQVDRWSQPQSFDEAWDERTALMANMVSPNSRVLEFGSGREQLEKFLPEGCFYQPSDLVARSPRTLVCDLNKGFPELDGRYDVIIFSGVIEYIHDLDRLFSAVRTHADSCIVSYAPTDLLQCMTTRLSNAWVNHLSEAALLSRLAKAGFVLRHTTRWQQQMIYQLT
jgi:hypothetical protein